MAQRLVLNSEKLKETMKQLASFYTPSKLYDYSNFVTIEVIEGKVCFDMCIIIGEATNNSMVSMWFDADTEQDELAMTLNFDMLNKFVKNVKSPTVDFVIEEKSITLVANTSTHTFEASTVIIPPKIATSMVTARNIGTQKLDFNALLLYNNIKNGGALLTMNTLNFSLYGIMVTNDGTFATDGFVMSRYIDENFNHLESTLFLPAYVADIIKSLGGRHIYMKVDKGLVYLHGEDFEFYFEEWMNKKDYPLDKLKKLIDTRLTPIDEDPKVFMDALEECASFGEIVTIDFTNGCIMNKERTHRISIKAQKGIGVLRLSTALLPKDKITWNSIEVDATTPRIRFEKGFLTKLVMGLKDESN